MAGTLYTQKVESKFVFFVNLIARVISASGFYGRKTAMFIKCDHKQCFCHIVGLLISVL